jgi:hypothetical protein
MSALGDAIGSVCVIGFLIVVAIVGASVGASAEAGRWRLDMVERGLAEYVVTDPLSGATEWRWKIEGER